MSKLWVKIIVVDRRINIDLADSTVISEEDGDLIPIRQTGMDRLASCGSRSTNGQTVISPWQGGTLAAVLALLGREASASMGELHFATGLETR